ncbi:LCP family protein [Kitasatospora indigofera]|uniref:LCP family protein n=1 Tax=Kitasatospora indigofera TaxID=67307 RepID=UPI00167C80C3|nr:LCP family protein [Kitasatospora indigofera]
MDGVFGDGSGEVSGGDEEFEVRLSTTFGRAAEGLGVAAAARLVDGGLEAGRRRRRRRRTVMLVGALTLAVAVGASALTLPSGLPGRASGALEAASSGAPAPLERGVTILLIGLEATTDAQNRPAPAELRRGELHAGAADVDVADTLVLVHIPAGGGTARQLSIPRDVLVDAPGGGAKVAIRQVYAQAEAAETTRSQGQGVSGAELRWRGREAGRAALIRSVQELAGVPVDHFAEVTMTGFYRAAQAVGTVPVCLNHAVDDELSGASLPAGRSELGPAQALAFVRQRHGVGDGSDLQRTRRAQAFLAGVLQKLRAGGVMADAGKLRALYDALKEDLVVDKGWNPVDFVRQVPAFAQGRAATSELPVQSEGAVLTAEPGKAKEILAGEGTSAAPAVNEVPCVD